MLSRIEVWLWYNCLFFFSLLRTLNGSQDLPLGSLALYYHEMIPDVRLDQRILGSNPGSTTHRVCDLKQMLFWFLLCKQWTLCTSFMRILSDNTDKMSTKSITGNLNVIYLNTSIKKVSNYPSDPISKFPSISLT